MKCGYCGESFDPPVKQCPHCGQDPGSGVYQTSTVLISEGKRHAVYPSVAKVPPRLRTRLMKSTSGPNAGTIIIADRRGRVEIAKALRRSPVEKSSPGPRLGVTRALAIALLVVIALMVLAVLSMMR